MKTIVLLIALFVLCKMGHTQQANTHQLRSKSQGTVPAFLNTDQRTPFYTFKIGTRDRYCSVQNSNDRKAAQHELMSSGFVVFGTEHNVLLTECAKKMCKGLFQEYKNPIYIFRSAVPTTFYADGNIFITTALLARLKSEEELAFWLAREYLLMDLNQSPTFTVNKLFPIKNTDDLLLYYTYREEKTLQQQDNEILNTLRAVRFSEEQLKTGFESMRNAMLPIGNHVVRPEGLSSERMTVPDQLLTVTVGDAGPRKKTENIAVYEEAVTKRIELAGLQSVDPKVGTSSGAGFQKLVGWAQMECLRLNIAACNFASALYELYNSDAHQSVDLDRLKALAWLGVVDQEFGSITKRKEYPFYGDLHPSAGFFSFYHLLNGNAKVAMALRVLTDLKETHAQDASFAMIQERAITILSEAERFDVSTFSNLSWQDAEAKLSAENLAVQPNEFYKYAISDLVKSGDLQKKSSTPPMDNLREQVVINGLTKVGLDAKRTEKIQAKFKEEHPPSTDENSSHEDYQFQEEYALLMLQSLERDNYNSPFIPVNFEAFENGQKEQVLYHHFEGRYAVQAKKSYFLALSVIAIPYICADMLMGSQLSWHTHALIDSETGVVLGVGQDFNRDYLTVKNIERRQTTIKNTYAN